MLGSVRQWINVRIGLDELVRTQLTEYRVPGDINFFYTLGFVALMGFVMQTVTGFFLLIYYIPHTDHAFQSVQYIVNEVPYGWLMRMMHVVGSNLLVVVVLVHMVSVFFMGSYKKPRELTWVTGALMLLTTLMFCLSGYLLPWSQLSFWATTITTNIPTAFPYIGGILAGLIRGGEVVSGPTLGRFFALHVTLLPALLLLLVGLHLFLVRRTGVSSPPTSKEATEEWTTYRHEEHPGGHPFYPHFVLRELYTTMFFFAAVFFIIAFYPTLFLPPEVNTPADPFSTPARIKPEWYFLAPYQMLRMIPEKFLGVLLQVVLLTVFLIWPFLDTGRQRNIMKRPVMLTVALIALAALIIISIWGKYS